MASTTRRSRRDIGEGVLAALLLAPAGALLALIVLFPILRLFWLSLHEVRLSEPWAGQPFVGLLNYRDIWADSRFWRSLAHTLLITGITVPGALCVGLGLAFLANLPFRVRWPVRLALLLPWALPLVFSGLIFAWFFDTSYGVVNDVLARLGLEGPAWLSRPGPAMAAICIAIVWKTSSFCALVLLAGLQTIPDTLHEAAAIDGAGRWQRFRHITLPLLRPAIMVALIFRTITAIQTFDIPFAMTRGGPGDATETLAMYVRTTTLDFLDFGYGSALAVVMFLISMAATAWYLRWIRGTSE
ncbi:carbohydrate ABC transporter permease [Benzoatithermus flavus]|uniref:Sugar ABC transporter permease n=1 Tax=Benzoatithermus flavus TaxID=3108223 RepID=A0ABU8XND9_9PROT